MAKTTITVTCKICGKPFQVEPHRLERGYGTVCSVKCRGISAGRANRNRASKVCERCGKTFEITASMDTKGKGRFCSRECQYPPVYSTCKNCGISFRHPPSDNAQYCSKKCAESSEIMRSKRAENTRKAWSEPESRERIMKGIEQRSQSDEWRNAPHFQKGVLHPRFKGDKRRRNTEMAKYEYKAWRIAVFKRDDYTCQKCGAHDVRIEAHHIKDWVNNPELRYEVSNGITLCEDCHIAVHGHKRSPRTRICVHCGERFRPRKTAQKYCSLKCFHLSRAIKPPED